MRTSPKKKIEAEVLDRTALEDANQRGVTGEARQVWAALENRVSEKKPASGRFAKNKAGRIVLATALMGSVAFGAAGCAPGTPKTATSASSPSETTKPTKPPEPSLYGDAMTLVDVEGNPVIVTNEHGEYEHVTINPEDESVTDFSKVDESTVAENGFTRAQGEEAQIFAAKWVVEQGVDGPGLDSTESYTRWIEAEADRHFLPKHKEDISTNGGEGGGTSLLVASPKANSGPFIADGKARVKSVGVSITDVYGYYNDGEKYIAVEGTVKPIYRISDETLMANTLEENPGVSRETILEQFPGLDDGKENTITRTTTFAYGLAPQADGTFMFSGYTVNYDPETVGY